MAGTTNLLQLAIRGNGSTDPPSLSSGPQTPQSNSLATPVQAKLGNNWHNHHTDLRSPQTHFSLMQKLQAVRELNDSSRESSFEDIIEEDDDGGSTYTPSAFSLERREGRSATSHGLPSLKNHKKHSLKPNSLDSPSQARFQQPHQPQIELLISKLKVLEYKRKSALSSRDSEASSPDKMPRSARDQPQSCNTLLEQVIKRLEQL